MAGLDDAHKAASEEYADRLQLQVAGCSRCGRVMLRLFVDKNVASSWSHHESLADVLLGRPLQDHERRMVQERLVLN